MTINSYWVVYKNLERELFDLSNLIHVDDKQLEIYSIKISELLIRTVVEIESISKELYFLNGGVEPKERTLYFDTDCLNLLETKWKLSKKQVLISAPNFHFTLNENKTLTPLRNANKNDSRSSDWKKAYQAIKHDRARNFTKGNLKHLIRAMASLFVLNLYYKGTSYSLEKDANGTNFDSSLGSNIFSIKIHTIHGFNASIEYMKKTDFDECVYILKPTDDTKNEIQNALKIINAKTSEKLGEQLKKQVFRVKGKSQDDIRTEFKSVHDKIESESRTQAIKENGNLLKKAFDSLKYEAILNKQQY